MKKINLRFRVKQIAVLATFCFVALSCAQDPNENPAPLEPTSVPEKSKLGITTNAKSKTADQNQLLAEIKKSTAPYHRVETAEADGYSRVSDCVSTPFGGMGYHYQNLDYLLDGVVDPSKPEILVYEPMKNGKLQLVAVEFMVIADQWEATNDDAPVLGNKSLDDHTAPGSGGPPFPHYQLHVWLWKHNPNGLYAPFNPNVSCEFAE